MSRGKYIWLISADDYLRRPYVLEKYVDCLETNPDVGYVFCCGYGVQEGVETRVMGQYAARGDRNRILPGHLLLKKLLTGNFILAPSGLVRRVCYEEISLFPLDMPWAGDWYLWCLFALYHDVGYFAEPMVCYREHHALSMTTKLIGEKLEACGAEEIEIPWIIVKKAQEAGYSRVAKDGLSAVAHSYARTLARERYRSSDTYMQFQRFEQSMRMHTTDRTEQQWLRARVFESVGNECYWQGDLPLARQFYRAAVKANPWMLAVHVKRVLLAFGKFGGHLRKLILSFQ